MTLIVAIFVMFQVVYGGLFADNALDKMIDYPIESDERYALMKRYAKMHYDLDHANLIQPKMIVIHYTGMATAGQVLDLFKKPRISENRDKLIAFGDVNVSAHFLVDRDGTIYSLLPTTVMGRHVIGFNYTAIGIENVGLDASRLNDDQVRANAMLVDMLLMKHPSIEYLIGHMEYMNQSLPHFKLFKAVVEDYEPTVKIDPGFTFLRRLRFHLANDYGIELKD